MLAWLFDNHYITTNCVLCFDGFLAPKGIGINKSILRDLQDEVKRETGFLIKLKIKPMNEPFDLSQFKKEI